MALAPEVAEKAYLDVNGSLERLRRQKELEVMRDAEEAMDKLIASGKYENEITYEFPCYISDEATVEFMERYRKVGWITRKWGTNCMRPIVAISRLPKKEERVTVPTKLSSESTDSPGCLYVDPYAYKREQEAKIEAQRKLEERMSTTPDSEKFDVVDLVQVNKHLVIKLRYPNCSKCSYEGNKILVFLNKQERDVIFWKKVDPHFRNNTKVVYTKNEAPGPDARFPASEQGWNDAVAFAKMKVG
jgi:hypothetical protein